MNVGEGQAFFGEFGDCIRFTSRTECVPDAPQLTWARPASYAAFRKNQQEQERYFLTLFLRWLFAHNMDAVTTPLTIRRAGGFNEPDFAAVEDDLEYGIEVSRATTRRLQRSLDALVRAQDPAFIELDPYLNVENDDLPFDPSSALITPGTRLNGEGWNGLEPERQWAALIAYRIGEKVKKLSEKYAKVFPTCDLLLYSDSHAPVIELESAVAFLKERIDADRKLATDPIFFRRISIVRESWAIFDVLGETSLIAKKEGWPFNS